MQVCSWRRAARIAGLHGNRAPWPRLLLGLWYETEVRLELSVPG